MVWNFTHGVWKSYSGIYMDHNVTQLWVHHSTSLIAPLISSKIYRGLADASLTWYKKYESRCITLMVQKHEIDLAEKASRRQILEAIVKLCTRTSLQDKVPNWCFLFSERPWQPYRMWCQAMASGFEIVYTIADTHSSEGLLCNPTILCVITCNPNTSMISLLYFLYITQQ